MLFGLSSWSLVRIIQQFASQWTYAKVRWIVGAQETHRPRLSLRKGQFVVSKPTLNHINPHVKGMCLDICV